MRMSRTTSWKKHKKFKKQEKIKKISMLEIQKK